jgi:hypothetical protein
MRAGCIARVVPYPSVINPARWYIHGAAQIRRGLPLVDAVILGAPRFSPYRSYAPFRKGLVFWTNAPPSRGYRAAAVQRDRMADAGPRLGSFSALATIDSITRPPGEPGAADREPRPNQLGSFSTATIDSLGPPTQHAGSTPRLARLGTSNATNIG